MRPSARARPGRRSPAGGHQVTASRRPAVEVAAPRGAGGAQVGISRSDLISRCHPLRVRTDGDSRRPARVVGRDAGKNRWFFHPVLRGELTCRTARSGSSTRGTGRRPTTAVRRASDRLLGFQKLLPRHVVVRDGRDPRAGDRQKAGGESRFTGMGWEVDPTAMRELLRGVLARGKNDPPAPLLRHRRHGAEIHPARARTGQVGRILAHGVNISRAISTPIG